MRFKLLDSSRVNDVEVQTLEMLEGMPIVKSNNKSIKGFAYVVIEPNKQLI